MFLFQPFYGGKKHKISAEVFSPGEKKAFLTIDGEWNGVMTAKWAESGVIVYTKFYLNYNNTIVKYFKVLFTYKKCFSVSLYVCAKI